MTIQSLKVHRSTSSYTVIFFTLILLPLNFTSCSSIEQSGKFTNRTWGDPSTFLTEMEGNGQNISDNDLKTLIENELIYNPNLGSKRPEVAVKEGVVTLSGEVTNPRALRTIEDQVRSQRYVKGFRNLTLVTPNKSRHDPRLSKDAKLALALNSNLVGENIDVFVNNGVIYLTGVVQNLSQKSLASHIVALGRGSFLIKNHIRVASASNG